MHWVRHLKTAATKATTGIYGIETHPNPRQRLITLYKDTLAQAQSIPPSAVYRQAVEALTKHRLAIVEQNESVEAIEQKLGERAGGQVSGKEHIEQTIMAAEDELKLMQKVKEWKPWEQLESEP